MAPGSIVIYLADPLNMGKMLVIDLDLNGRLVCEAIHPDAHGDYYRDAFDAQEIELYDVWMKALDKPKPATA